MATIFENLEDGLTIEEIMEQFDVTREQVTAVLDFAAVRVPGWPGIGPVSIRRFYIA